MATEKQKRDANRMVSLTYMVSSCLGFSIEGMDKYLRMYNLHLAGRDKQLFNRIQAQIKQLKSNLNLLEELAFGVMGKNEEDTLAYEDSIHIYWAAFLILVDRAGTDELCDLRFKALIDLIRKYKSHLQLPGVEMAYEMAFMQVENAIKEGKYSKSDFKHLLEVPNENRTKETKG